MSAAVLSRRQLGRRWRRLGLLGALLATAAGVKAAAAWERDSYLSFNWTESLPYWVFLVDETAEPETGDYVDFWPPDNPYYDGISFVKRIAAGPGERVECEGRVFLVRGEEIARAKPDSLRGEPLAQGPCGTVPAGHYFVVTPHEDSFDSRYEEIGYVPRDRVRGVARPLL
jgi:conjugal transfer pilin signal peptidase TrbI